VGAVAGGIGGELFSRATTGKGLYDLFSVKEERWQAMFDAEQEAAKLEKAELEALVQQLEAERQQLEEWGQQGNLLFGFDQWQDIPEDLKGALGAPSGMLIKEEWTEVNAQIEAAAKRLRELEQTERVAVARAQEYTDEARRWWLTTTEWDRSLQAALGRAQALTPPLHEVGVLVSSAQSGSNALAVVWDLVNSRLEEGVDLLRGFSGMARTLEDVMHRIPSATDLSEQLGQQAGAGWDQMVSLTGLVDPATLGRWGDAYTRELTALYMQMRGREQWEIDLAVQAFKNSWDERINKVRTSADEIEGRQSEMASQAQQAWSEWESFAGGLLQPTQVTAEDMALSEVGAYEDKWDEYVRRLRAAQTDMQSPFRKMLPTDVEQGGQGTINAWVEQQIRSFYAGMMPDQVNWDALIAEYDRMVEEKLGRNKLLDIFMQKLIESGRTPDEYMAKKTMGMESPLKAMWFGGLSPEEAGQDLQVAMQTAVSNVSFAGDQLQGPATSFVSNLSMGIESTVRSTAWADPLIVAFRTDVTNKRAKIMEVGGLVGAAIFDGMRQELRKYRIIDVIVEAVIEELEGAMAEEGGVGL
jgi:hypothetical protein